LGTKKYLSRNLDAELLKWKQSEGRKPLLLRGARQVGKSSLVRELGKSFESFVEINFESDRRIHQLFSGNLDAAELIEKISIYLKTDLIPGKTLLFFDEIQACVPALSSLRFFYEQMPELHLIAAGSLLEFALEQLPSFGVGRIRSVFVYPFSFDEFLSAIGEEKLCALKRKSSPDALLEPIFHQKLVDLFKRFLLIGGMPEAVATSKNGNNLLEVQSVLDDLIVSLKADFAKYKSRVPASRIQEVFDSVVSQMGSKFIYSKAALETRQPEIKEALELLIMAGLVIPVVHTSANGLPLGAESDAKKRKMLMFDSGIFQRILGLDMAQILFQDDFALVNSGAIAEMVFGLEWLKYQNPFQSESLYYWHREAATSNAELDYVVQKNTQILPIEVKAGSRGSMQSMHLFLKEKQLAFGVRVSLEPFGRVDQIAIYPLYAVRNLRDANVV
jgi:uncharacterized protein